MIILKLAAPPAIRAKIMTIIKSYKGLDLVKLDQPVNGNYYAVRYHKERKAKTCTSYDKALEVFNACIIK